MKLKNKISGEIKEFALFDGNELQGGVTLEILTKEWEDYEETKEFWFMDEEGIIRSTKEENWPEESVVAAKSIGNYFDSREEAEKAVERLRAWKRLKDKGFRFDGYDVAHNSNGDLCGQLFYNAGDYCIEDVEKDLDLLFCPEVKNE